LICRAILCILLALYSNDQAIVRKAIESLELIFTNHSRLLSTSIINATFFYVNHALIQIASCFPEEFVELVFKLDAIILEHCTMALKINEISHMLSSCGFIQNFKRMSSPGFTRLKKTLYSTFHELKGRHSRHSSIVGTDIVKDIFNQLVEHSVYVRRIYVNCNFDKSIDFFCEFYQQSLIFKFNCRRNN
jgi:hypothetical protein